MNYEIPDREKVNFISVYWQMLVEIEGKVEPQKDIFEARLVEGAYNILNRAGITNNRPRWEKDNVK